MNPTGSIMRPLTVRSEDGVFHLLTPDGARTAIRLGGEPVSRFLPGWRPRGGAVELGSWVLLDLVHENGGEATWILDAAGEHRANSVSTLPEAAVTGIAETVLALAHATYRDVLCRPRPRRPAGLDRLAGINGSMVADLLDLALRRAPIATRVVDLAEAGAEAGIEAGGFALARPHKATLRLRALSACMAGNIQDAFDAAMRTGSLAWPSPVDGHELMSCHSVIVGEHRAAYRFVDARHDMVFYLGVTHAHFLASDLFIPEANLAFRQHPDDQAPLHRLGEMMLGHALANMDPLLTYLASPSHRLATTCRGVQHMHIGHHLWNELTGLDRLVRRLGQRDLPMVIIADADEGSEAFAPIDQIFPELAGKIDRTLRAPRALAEHVYAQDYCLLRVLDDHVTSGLAARIRATAAHEAPTRYDQALGARLEAEGTPVILLGIRVENRTAVDLEAMVSGMIDHMQRRLGPVAVVLDGHNARCGHDPVSSFGSAGQHGAHEHPVFDELRLAQALHRRFAGAPVRIINLFGAAMSRSLFWTQRCCCFVAFWGAGLAKYRWVCNRPGLVLSSRWNLMHRDDLGIYHQPRYQEAGAPLAFIDASQVTDMHEAPVLFSPHNPVPTYSNFSIAPDALRQAIDAMINEHVPRRGHARAAAP